MLPQISAWALMLSAASSVLASPLVSSSYKRGAESGLVDRQFECPDGLHCGPGPVCTSSTCDIPGCADAEVCQGNTGKKRSTYLKLVGRQFECPPGIECGPGPECTAATCDISGCADAEVCQGYKKRSTYLKLVGRQFECPPGIECGPGPECTAATCDISGCADAEVCQDNGNTKRSAETDIVHPVCDICYIDDSGVTVCGCDTASGGVERRGEDKVCPEYCIITENGETLCGCAAQAYENSV